MGKPLNLVMIYGSVRAGRFCDTVGRWTAAQVQGHPDFELRTIDPAPDWPNLDEARLCREIGAADGILILTPEYNHSFPGPLKMLIDSAFDEWKAKPVAFVSYGGVAGGLRAVEHLRAVFAELNAVAIRNVVSFQNAWEVFGRNGKPLDEERYARSLGEMLSQLAWWARLLKSGREAQAYGEAA